MQNSEKLDKHYQFIYDTNRPTQHLTHSAVKQHLKCHIYTFNCSNSQQQQQKFKQATLL